MTPNNVHPLVAEGSGIQTLNVVKDVLIDAPLDIVWESILEEIGPAGTHGDGTPMPMQIELWPGGRWYRDLGDTGGNDAGHLWGHVQVIKPPKLLELNGPLFMSYPAVSHVQYRLIADGADKTRLKLTHRAIGLIDPEHAKGVNEGWQEVIDVIVKIAARRSKMK
ncbi:MAG: SRPBCC domain-containing protein [Planctomycetota bacterium]|nr:SRPBCC domain-containing protein [Planctomycetota bacterium]